MAFEIGDKMPDFTFRDGSRREVKLSDFEGKNIVLAFYVLAFTRG